jgi:hypothetical protein
MRCPVGHWMPPYLHHTRNNNLNLENSYTSLGVTSVVKVM